MRRDPAPRLAALVELGLIVLLASLMADLAALQLSQPASVLTLLAPRASGERRPDADRQALTGVDPFFRTGSSRPVRLDAALPDTSLSLRLFGIRAEGGGNGSVVIATPDGRQDVYRPGDSPLDGVSIKSIAADHVVLDRQGAYEALHLGERRHWSSETPIPEAQKPVAPQPDFSAILDSLRLAPDMRNGEIHGFVIKEFGTATFLQRNGLILGDIVLTVDGAPLTAIAELRRRFEALSSAGSVTVEYERNGERRRVHLTLGG